MKFLLSGTVNNTVIIPKRYIAKNVANILKRAKQKVNRTEKSFQKLKFYIKVYGTWVILQ